MATSAPSASAAVVAAIDRHGLGIRYGDFHSRRLVERLGLAGDDGVLRVSMVRHTKSVGPLRGADFGFAQTPRGLVTRDPGLVGRISYHNTVDEVDRLTRALDDALR